MSLKYLKIQQHSLKPNSLKNTENDFDYKAS